MSDYNAIYATTDNALGPPYAALMQSIHANVPAGSSVLDVGCGQGRDALPLAIAGYRVTAIDVAPSGIASLTRAAEMAQVNVDAGIADLRIWRPKQSFDVLLCNRIFHMMSAEDRSQVLADLIDHVDREGFVFLIDELRNMTALKQTIADKSRAPCALRESKGDYFVQLDQQKATI